GSRGEFGEHQRVVLEVAREDAHLRSLLVNLYPDAVVLRLDGDQAKTFDHGLRVRQALRELAADRPPNRDLERADRAFPSGPEGLRNPSQIGHAVVGTLEHRSE